MNATYLSFRFSKTCTRVFAGSFSRRLVVAREQTDVHSVSPASVSTYPSSMFSIEDADPIFRLEPGKVRSSPLTLGCSRSLRHTLSDMRSHHSSRTIPSTSIASDRCVGDGVTRLESLHAPTESSRFLMGLVCNELSSRALPQAVPRTLALRRYRWVGRPSRTDLLTEEHQCPSQCSVFAPPPYESVARTPFTLRIHSAAWNSRQPLLDVSRQVGRRRLALFRTLLLARCVTPRNTLLCCNARSRLDARSREPSPIATAPRD